MSLPLDVIRCKGNNIPIPYIGIYTTNALTIEGLITVADCPYVSVRHITTSVSTVTFI